MGRKSDDASKASISRRESVIERERIALAELREICRKNSVSWSQSDVIPPEAFDDSFEESILL